MTCGTSPQLTPPSLGSLKLLELQVGTCRKHVYVEPNNALALNTLGDALLTLYNINEGRCPAH